MGSRSLKHSHFFRLFQMYSCASLVRIKPKVQADTSILNKSFKYLSSPVTLKCGEISYIQQSDPENRVKATKKHIMS